MTAESASANVNGGALTYADGTVARLEVVWLTPVLPRSQFVVTGPNGLATLDPPLAELVDLKFFSGFSFADIAALRGVSERTVQRDWAKARLILHTYLQADQSALLDD